MRHRSPDDFVKKSICFVALHTSPLRRTQKYASLLGTRRLASGAFYEAAPDLRLYQLFTRAYHLTQVVNSSGFARSLVKLLIGASESG